MATGRYSPVNASGHGEEAVVFDTDAPSVKGWVSNLTSPLLHGETHFSFHYNMAAAVTPWVPKPASKPTLLPNPQ